MTEADQTLAAAQAEAYIASLTRQQRRRDVLTAICLLLDLEPHLQAMSGAVLRGENAGWLFDPTAYRSGVRDVTLQVQILKALDPAVSELRKLMQRYPWLEEAAAKELDDAFGRSA